MDKTQAAKQILTMLLSAGLGAGRPMGTTAVRLMSAVNNGNRGVSGLGSAADAFIAKNYPSEFAPHAWHEYEVVNIPGKEPNHNQNGKVNKSIIDVAGVMQDLDLHNKTITQFLRPGMSPKEEREALQKGLEAEKKLPQFWNESSSRLPYSVSSTAVSGIRLTPDARIEVQWHTSPKWYTFKQYPNTYEASKAAQQLLKADSIGQAVYPVIYRQSKQPKWKPKPELGTWNTPNYDAAFV